MEKMPFSLQVDLDGWELFWAFLEVGEDQTGLPGLRQRVADDVRRRFSEAAAVEPRVG